MRRMSLSRKAGGGRDGAGSNVDVDGVAWFYEIQAPKAQEDTSHGELSSVICRMFDVVHCQSKH
jgi:hypothetical protein